MAMTKCLVCDMQISEFAAECIHCGSKVEEDIPYIDINNLYFPPSEIFLSYDPTRVIKSE